MINTKQKDIMKLYEESRHEDGTVSREYTNGYKFEGKTNIKSEPLSGTITTPEGLKYTIPDFKGENVYEVFQLIEQGMLEKFFKDSHERD